jgi:hypothetical protein
MGVQNRIARFVVASLFSIAPAGLVSAQSLNIDLDSPSSGPALGGGVPSSGFGAASGQTGVWNSYAATSGPISLVGLGGGATTATLSITATSTTVSVTAFNNANNTGDFALLLNDAQQIGTTTQGGTRTYTFNGLTDGPYSLYTYAVPPANQNGEIFINIPGSSEGTLISTGTMPGNSFVLGRTHVIHTLNVVGGSFSVNVSDVAGAPSAYVSGFQLVVPEPSMLAILPLSMAMLARQRRRA